MRELFVGALAGAVRFAGLVADVHHAAGNAFDEAHFLALASRIARNLIVDRVRRPRVKRFESFTANLSAGQLADSDRTPSQAAEGVEAIERMLEALESLSEDHQKVIELRHFEDLPFKAIGEQMGRTESAVQVLHARAVTKLGLALSGPGDLP